MEPLTKKQRRVWDYLRETILTRKYPPSVREICRELGFNSSSTAHAYLRTLEKKGYIRRNSTMPRAIELMVSHPPYQTSEGITFIPLVGEVTAGEPILAEQNIEGYFPLPEEGSLAGGEGTFMLRIS